MASVPSFNKSDENSSELKYRTHVEYQKSGPDGNDLVGLTVFNESQHTYKLKYDVKSGDITTVDVNGSPKAPFALHTHLVNELVAALNKNLPASN